MAVMPSIDLLGERFHDTQFYFCLLPITFIDSMLRWPSDFNALVSALMFYSLAAFME